MIKLLLKKLLNSELLNKLTNLKYVLLDIRGLDIVILFTIISVVSNIFTALISVTIYTIWEIFSNKRLDYVMLDIIGVGVGWMIYSFI